MTSRSELFFYTNSDFIGCNIKKQCASLEKEKTLGRKDNNTLKRQVKNVKVKMVSVIYYITGPLVDKYFFKVLEGKTLASTSKT